MKCVFCLKEINDDLIFCPYCGRKIATPEPEQKYMPEYETGNSRDTDSFYEAPQSQRSDYPVRDQGQEYPVGNQAPDYSRQYNDNDEDDMVYYEDEFDDYTRDNDDALYYDKKSPMYNGYRNRNYRKKSNSNVWLIVLAVVLALLVTGVTCWLLISALSKDSDKLTDDNKIDDITEAVYNCSICKKEMSEDEKYCDDCIDKYTCKICEQISKDTENGFCDDCSVEYKCRSCNKIDEDVNDGYCSDCFTELKCKSPGCNNVITSGYYCKSCIKANVSGGSEGKCYVCNEKIDDSAIYLIDSKGRAYCKDCDKGRYCSKCFGYLPEGTQGDTCPECIQFNCAKCGRTMSRAEVVVTDSNNKTYCDNCDTGLYCETCGAPIKNNETQCKNCAETE